MRDNSILIEGERSEDVGRVKAGEGDALWLTVYCECSRFMLVFPHDVAVLHV